MDIIYTIKRKDGIFLCPLCKRRLRLLGVKTDFMWHSPRIFYYCQDCNKVYWIETDILPAELDKGE